jgi:hypothetical protein
MMPARAVTRATREDRTQTSWHNRGTNILQAQSGALR